MADLRWILLGLGVLFCLGLWGWEVRRRRAQAQRGSSRGGDLSMGASADATRGDTFQDEFGDEFDDDFNESMRSDAAEIGARRPMPTARDAHRIEPVLGDAMPGSAGGREPRLSPSFELDEGDEQKGTAAAPDFETYEDHGTADDTVDGADGFEAEADESPSEEKIIVLRLTASAQERFDGGQLLDALRATGLEHGKFSIFHRHADDGGVLFSVASMMEPGTFAPESMMEQTFPGIAFFARFDARSSETLAFETMLQTAQRLAQQLHGHLQDERGAPLTVQRLSNLRSELNEWRSSLQ